MAQNWCTLIQVHRTIDGEDKFLETSIVRQVARWLVFVFASKCQDKCTEDNITFHLVENYLGIFFHVKFEHPCPQALAKTLSSIHTYIAHDQINCPLGRWSVFITSPQISGDHKLITIQIVPSYTRVLDFSGNAIPPMGATAEHNGAGGDGPDETI